MKIRKRNVNCEKKKKKMQKTKIKILLVDVAGDGRGADKHVRNVVKLRLRTRLLVPRVKVVLNLQQVHAARCRFFECPSGDFERHAQRRLRGEVGDACGG